MKQLLKTLKIISSVILILILVLVLFQKLTDSKLTIGNIYIFQVATSSMVPDYEVGDVIIVKKTAPESLEVGDDVTYLGSAPGVKDLRITHRIVEKKFYEQDGKYYFRTKGIANEVEDPQINEDNIYGKVVYHTILFSFLGRLLTNMIVYYVVFIVIGVSVSYDIISSWLIKGDDDDEWR